VTTTPEAPLTASSGPVPVEEVERELARQLRAVAQPGQAPVLRAHLSNLVIYCGSEALAEKVEAEIPAIVTLHPARVLLLIATAAGEARPLTATVRVRCHRWDRRRISSEQVTLRAQGEAVNRLPFAVRALLIADVPINLWWAMPEPPALGGALLFELGERAQQIIYDSIGWPQPARDVLATAMWLAEAECSPNPDRWRALADLNWRRLKYWRRLLAQALDPASAPGALDSITEVAVEHGPHAVIQAWELVSWLASRLGWRVQAGQTQPGTEICWQLSAPRNRLQARLRRLDQGPSNIRQVRIACNLNGKPGALRFQVDTEYRLAVVPEGVPAEPRTITVAQQSLTELVARQLSDRERDPVFRESMSVGRSLAESVLGK
jgi:glucose-6-phosphate dehydrogenase assembly protein OpcA